MSMFNENSNLNFTMINSNNNRYKDFNNKNDFDQDSLSSSYQIQNLQQNRRNSRKDDDDNSFPNTNDSSIVPVAVSHKDVEGVRYGKCKWFNVAKGWGFITPTDGGNEVFVHQSVIQMSGFRSLGEQEDVEFECHLTERGLEATRVSGRQGTDCHGSTFRPRTKKRHRRVRCYNCGEFANHIASKCHLGPQPKRCHLCKQDDHLFANCPTKKVPLFVNTNQTAESLQHSTNEEASIASEDDTNIKPEMTNSKR